MLLRSRPGSKGTKGHSTLGAPCGTRHDQETGSQGRTSCWQLPVGFSLRSVQGRWRTPTATFTLAVDNPRLPETGPWRDRQGPVAFPVSQNPVVAAFTVGTPPSHRARAGARGDAWVVGIAPAELVLVDVADARPRHPGAHDPGLIPLGRGCHDPCSSTATSSRWTGALTNPGSSAACGRPPSASESATTSPGSPCGFDLGEDSTSGDRALESRRDRCRHPTGGAAEEGQPCGDRS